MLDVAGELGRKISGGGSIEHVLLSGSVTLGNTGNGRPLFGYIDCSPRFRISVRASLDDRGSCDGSTTSLCNNLV